MTRLLYIAALAGALLAPAVRAQEPVLPPDISKTHGRLLPNVALVGEDSTVFHLADLLGKPLIVSPIFTSCPHTCSFITASLRDALAEIGEPGIGYNVLTVSFDPADGPAQLRHYRERLELPAGWRLAVTGPADLTALLDAIDFHYLSMEGGGFAHANVIAIIDPEMKVSGYMHGVTYDPGELRKELERAVHGTSLIYKARPLIFVVSVLGVIVTTVVLIATARKKRPANA